MDELSIGERELDVLGVLWEAGSGTAGEVRDRLSTDLAYTTVLTLLRRLEAKGYIRHETEGKAHRYYPVVARHAARENAIGRVIDKLFAGSAERLVAHLVDERHLSAKEIARLRERLEQGTRGKKP